MKLRIGSLIAVLAAVLCGIVYGQQDAVKESLATKEKYDRAVHYCLEKKYQNALDFFAQAVKEEPDPYKAIVYFNMGMCFQLAGVAEREKKNEELSQALFAQAALLYAKVQKEMPYFSQMYSNAALIAYYQNKPSSVVDDFTVAAQQITNKVGAFPPDVDGLIYSYRSTEALLSIAANYIAGSQYSKALPQLNAAIANMEKTKPRKDYLQYTAYNSLALCLFNVDSIALAIDAIEKSITIAPAQPALDVSYANLGMLYFKKGDFFNSRKAIDKALSVNPKNSIALEYEDKLKKTQK